MEQLRFFDLSNRYVGLHKYGDSLVMLKATSFMLQ